MVGKLIVAVCALVSVGLQTAEAQVYRASPGVRIRAIAATATSPAGDIAAAVQLSNGMFVIADNASRKLHFFSAGGRFIRSVGQPGTAPGEFQSVRWVGECGRDSVYAYDFTRNRISVFAADGKLARTFASPIGGTNYVRCTTDGIMLYVAVGGMNGLQSHGAFQTSDANGKLLHRTPELLLDEGRPLGKSIKIAIAPDGIVYGNGDSAYVTTMSIRGEAPRRIPAGVVGRAPTDSNRSIAMEYLATAIKGTEYEYERMRRMLRKLPPVKTLPAYSDVFIDPATKAVWVRTSNMGDPSTVLERRGMDGVLQGTATLPPALEIQQIRGDVLVAMQSDPKTGTETLVTWRLMK